MRAPVPPIHFDVVIVSSAVTAVRRGIAMIRAEYLLGLARAGLAVTVSQAIAAVLSRESAS